MVHISNDRRLAGVAAVALAGGLALALAGCSGAVGKGGADKNNDGKISLQEFGAELKEMKHPKPGRWKIAAEGTSGDDSFVKFTGEVPVCSEGFWAGFDEGLAELAKPENEKKFDEAMTKFAKENNGKFEVERFDVDGDKVDLQISGSGKGNQGAQSVEGGAAIALKGIVAETTVDLQGKFDYNFNLSGQLNGSTMTLEGKVASITKLKGERVGDCPPAPKRTEENSFEGFDPEASASDVAM